MHGHMTLSTTWCISIGNNVGKAGTENTFVYTIDIILRVFLCRRKNNNIIFRSLCNHFWDIHTAISQSRTMNSSHANNRTALYRILSIPLKPWGTLTIHLPNPMSFTQVVIVRDLVIFCSRKLQAFADHIHHIHMYIIYIHTSYTYVHHIHISYTYVHLRCCVSMSTTTFPTVKMSTESFKGRH
jgi:hypothetical protein